MSSRSCIFEYLSLISKSHVFWNIHCISSFQSSANPMISVCELPNHCCIEQIFWCGALVFPDCLDLLVWAHFLVVVVIFKSPASSMFCVWGRAHIAHSHCSVPDEVVMNESDSVLSRFWFYFVSHICPVMYPVPCGRLQPGSHRFTGPGSRNWKKYRHMCLLSILSSFLFFFHVSPVMYLSTSRGLRCWVACHSKSSRARAMYCQMPWLQIQRQYFRRHFVVALSCLHRMCCIVKHPP